MEAERFLEKALKRFPEDGYFLKYKADLLWMNGNSMKALSLYAQVREKTANGIVCLEMERFFKENKAEILKSCESMIANKAKKEAVEVMELWRKILPDDEEIEGAWYLAKVANAHTQTELENEIRNIRKKIGTYMKNPVDPENTKKIPQEWQMYQKALTRAWKRLGYPQELAALRTEIICTSDESELEWLAEQVRSRLIHKEERACVYKLVGDIRSKQGQTKSAFENYRKAVDYVSPSYIKTELYRILINDLNGGSRQVASFAKKTDVTAALDNWLDKYGSLEEIQTLAKKLV